MLSELGKVNKQIEASPLGKGELQEGCIQEPSEIADGAEKVMETPEASEVSQKELEEGTKILQPDMELIKTKSLEAVKQSNIEKTHTSVEEDGKFRELTAKEKQYLKENTNLSETAIESIRVDTESNYHLKCRKEELAGKNHEVTGVKYVEKTITVDSVEITVIVPEFPSVFDCNIPPEIWNSGDREIFKSCTELLRDYLEANPKLKASFDSQQLEQIISDEPYIKGYTWHHSENPGQMQLVETKTHVLSGHTGGNSIWCGGIR